MNANFTFIIFTGVDNEQVKGRVVDHGITEIGTRSKSIKKRKKHWVGTGAVEKVGTRIKETWEE